MTLKGTIEGELNDNEANVGVNSKGVEIMVLKINIGLIEYTCLDELS